MQSPNVKCVAFVSKTFTRHGSNITKVWQEILTPMTLAFSCEVVHKKNYENTSIFVKVTAKKSVAPFLSGHGVYNNNNKRIVTSWLHGLHGENKNCDNTYGTTLCMFTTNAATAWRGGMFSVASVCGWVGVFVIAITAEAFETIIMTVLWQQDIVKRSDEFENGCISFRCNAARGW